jgi:hypothetical protein
MMKYLNLLMLSACANLGLWVQAEPAMEQVEHQFRTLPMEARRLTGPLFWMHGDETKEQLEKELQNVVEGGNGTFTAEPRPHKDWLGEGWFRDLDICLQFARKNNLTMIIYDDWWWPSQMMGGRVPPQYGSKRLEASAVTVEGPKTLREAGYGPSNLVAVVAGRVVEGDAMDASTLVNLTSSVKDGTLSWEVPQGRWKVMLFTWRFTGSQGGQRKYISVDGASPDCVEWFIETVYQPHFDRFKADFGKTIVGYFYDEPETQGDWGSDVPKLIAERKLDLAKLLVGYKFKLAGDEQIAAFQTYLNVFADSWGRTMYGGMSKWCQERKVYSMGHFMEHNSDIFSRGMSGGNMMQLQKYSDMGGIDLVCNQLYPGERKMGSYQMPKIASSISHTYNKADDIDFCEIFGGYGQKVTYPQMKWLADWHQVRGVNFLIPHSFNPRAPFDGDYPPYFNNGGFEPRWPLYRVWADYTSRLSLLLTGGRHVCPVAFLHVGQSIQSGKAVRPEEMTSTLQDALYDCDWVNYDAFENDATLSGKEIKLHKETYPILVVPPVEVISYASLEKAKAFFEKGGVVVGYGFLPAKSATLGKNSSDVAALCKAIWGEQPVAGTKACRTNPQGGRAYLLSEKPSVAEITAALGQDAGVVPTLQVVKGDTGNWLHILHREKTGSDFFLVCNQNHTGAARDFTFRITAKGEPECWDALRNELTSVPFTRLSSGQVEVSLTLEPSESVVLVFHKEKRQLPRRLDGTLKPLSEPIRVVRGETPASLIIPSAPVEPPAVTNSITADGKPAKKKRVIVSPVKSDPFVGICDLPATVKLDQARVFIEMDELAPEEAARVTINGKYAGGFIGKPFRLEVTPHLVVGQNKVIIEPFAPKNVVFTVYSK